MNYDSNIVQIDNKKLMDKIYECLDDEPLVIGSFADKVGVPMEYLEPIMRRLAYAYKIAEKAVPRTWHMAYFRMTDKRLKELLESNQRIVNNEGMKTSIYLGEFERKVERIKKEIDRRTKENYGRIYQGIS